MAELKERYEVVAESDGRNFVFLAEPGEGRLTIREVDEEEAEVERRFDAGDSLDAIARSTGRSRRAIEMRLAKLGLLDAEARERG